MNSAVLYTVVVPVYNGSDSLNELCNRIMSTMSAYSFEVIFINDASTDNSWNVIVQLKEQFPQIIRAINFDKNYGQHAALLCAFAFSRGAFVVTIDDDLQFDPEDILLLIDKQKETGSDVVYGLLANKQHSAMRNLATNYVHAASKLEDKNEKGSSFRLIAKKVTNAIAENHKHNFVFIDEVIQWYTSSFSFVDVNHKQRMKGSSGYNWNRLFRMYINILTNYSATPLRLMIYTGGFFSFIFFFAGIIFMLRKLLYNVPIGYTSIIVTILFSASIIMFCLGVIGLYLFKIYTAYQNKPLYTIKNII